jgi:hypothetical protein
MVASLGLTPKSSTGWRLYDNWSKPLSSSHLSINDVIIKAKEKFDTLDMAILQFINAGSRAWLLSADFEAAYRQVWTRPQDRHLGGIFVPGRGYAFRTSLNFGARSSEPIWERVARSFLALLLFGYQWSYILHWVDDLFRVHQSKHALLALRSAILHAATRFGYDMARHKLRVGQVLPFVGVTFNTLNMSLSIAPIKRVKAAALLKSLLGIHL